MAYDFLQGIDYGPRKGTLGFQIHMAEGGDGTARWLAQRSGETRAAWIDRVNGVSSNFVIQSTGNVIQMLDWTHASGNANPRDRSTDKAFYGRRYLVEVLGDKWADPNAYTISVEICGFRRDGPTQKQVDALVELVADARKRFPTLRGAFGHADQTDTKGCPGTAPTMIQFWDRVGHGLFKTEVDVIPAPITDETEKIVTANAGHTWRDLDGKTVLEKERPALAARISPYGVKVGTQNLRAIYATVDGVRRTVLIAPATVTDPPATAPAPSNCTDEVAAAIAADRAKARVAYD